MNTPGDHDQRPDRPMLLLPDEAATISPTPLPAAYHVVTGSRAKSVSVDYASLLAAGDPTRAQHVREAHDQTVRSAVEADDNAIGDAGEVVGLFAPPRPGRFSAGIDGSGPVLSTSSKPDRAELLGYRPDLAP